MSPVLANITGDWYWILIALVVLFGGSQLPKLAKNTGEALKEFRKSSGSSNAAPQPPEGPQPATANGAQPERPTPAQLQAGTSDERVTLTRSELDALLADREARAKEQAAKPEA
jgi:TatA/E family protein of Tat protein translocase